VFHFRLHTKSRAFLYRPMLLSWPLLAPGAFYVPGQPRRPVGSGTKSFYTAKNFFRKPPASSSEFTLSSPTVLYFGRVALQRIVESALSRPHGNNYRTFQQLSYFPAIIVLSSRFNSRTLGKFATFPHCAGECGQASAGSHFSFGVNYSSATFILRNKITLDVLLEAPKDHKEFNLFRWAAKVLAAIRSRAPYRNTRSLNSFSFHVVCVLLVNVCSG